MAEETSKRRVLFPRVLLFLLLRRHLRSRATMMLPPRKKGRSSFLLLSPSVDISGSDAPFPSLFPFSVRPSIGVLRCFHPTPAATPPCAQKMCWGIAVGRARGGQEEGAHERRFSLSLSPPHLHPLSVSPRELSLVSI